MNCSGPWRYRRIWEVLYPQHSHGLTDSHALQRDYTSELAVTALAQIGGLTEMGPAGALLGSWDRALNAESAAAALWAVWYYRHLSPAVAEVSGGEAARLMQPFDSLSVINYLKGRQDDELLRNTLSAAWNECKTLLGEQPELWRWGDLHEIRFRHPLLNSAEGDLAELMDIPSYPRGGSRNTTNNTGFDPADFLVYTGASFRVVLDVGRWDNARMTNAPGQSGDPRSPFYDNLLNGWARDLDFPLLWSDKKIRQHTKLLINLRPVTE